MQIFLSWSGSTSRKVSTALREWLPMVLQQARPWQSDKDIVAGGRWAVEIGRHLSDSQFGIICLTRDNMLAPWLLFEAGALSKSLDASAVCPYLLDVEPSDLAGPLAQFQAKQAKREPTFELVRSLNQATQNPIEVAALAELFDALWPKLEARLDAIARTMRIVVEMKHLPNSLGKILTLLGDRDYLVTSIETRQTGDQEGVAVITGPAWDVSKIQPTLEFIRSFREVRNVYLQPRSSGKD